MTAWVNYDDVIDQLRAGGLLIDTIEVGTPKPKRCKVDGDREKRGWYWLSDIELRGKDGERAWYIVGSYGIWRGTDNGSTKIQLPKGDDRAELTADQRSAIAARHKENAKRAAALRQQEAERAAMRASAVWRRYVTSGESDYLKRKGVHSYGVRYSPTGNGTLAVPMCDAAGRVWGLQIIRGKNRGGKLDKEYFPKGVAVRGHFHLLGAVAPGGVVLEAEGYATAATLHEDTGLPVAVAFDAGNLLPVAQALRAAYRGVRVLVCADDDYRQKCKACGKLTDVENKDCQHCGQPHRQNNPGWIAAQAAALAVSGAVCVPQFPADRAGAKLTDFNDLHQFPDAGAPLVRAQIEAAIALAGWNVGRQTARAPQHTSGAGERPHAVSCMSLDEAVVRFVPIDDGTGKYLFDTWASRIVQRDQMMAVLRAGLRWDDIKSHPAWIERGAFYLDQVGFDPTGEDPDCKLNIWTGWPTEPQEGSCELQLDLLRYLCNAESKGVDIFDWLLRWLAYPLQHPGAKMKSAVVIHGPQGTGKSQVFESYVDIYGKYGVVIGQGALEDKFNDDWMSGKLFVLADEVVARQEMYHLKNQLKGYITGKTVRVNPKNVAAHNERNHMNLLFLSNEKQPVILENDDRRHLIIWTPPKLDPSLYDEVAEEIANGGTAALHQYLLDLDLGDFKPWTQPPMTQAKRALIELNQESSDYFIDQWISGDLDLPLCPCKSSHLYQAYRAHCRAVGEQYPRNDRQFFSALDKRQGWRRAHFDVYDNFNYEGKPKRARLVLPSEEAFAKHAASGQKSYVKKPDQTQTEWLTDSVIEFENVLQAGEGA